ncbi:hypothetical protein EYC59_03495 [Candidatus Saccharibacteria bacterium]|nr:MAG: hypothetical protein EYC59_03495 [Candidatus Saccharibacteria bacterium]
MNARLFAQQTGDTIVEVLIAVAVIAFTITGAYALSLRSTVSTQDAQERGQALKLVETQLEFLRNAGTISGGNCFDTTGMPTNTCTFTPNGAGTDPAYTMTVAANANGCTNSYSVQAVWDGIGGGVSNVSMCYRTES